MTQPDPTAVLARIRQMADYWEQHLPEVIRTPAVVSAIRAALKPAVVPPADQAAFEADVDSQTGPKAASKDPTVLRDRIRRAVCEAEGFAWDSDMLEPDEYGEVADMVLAVLPPPVDRAACICGHTEQQHFEDVCITELTGCACGYFLPVEAAAEEIARLARCAGENRLALSQALGLGTGAPWSAIRERAAEPRRLAAETQQPEPDDESLRAKVDEATATLRRMRSVVKHWEQQTLPHSQARLLLTEVRDALAGPRPDPEADAEPTEEQIVRDHVTTVHLIGEQLAGIESWMWERLADVREAARQELGGPLPDDAVLDGQGAGTVFSPGEGVYGQDPHYVGVVAQQQPDTETRPARGDQFEAWLKAQRDEFARGDSPWPVLDYLLDNYRLHADTGTPLDEHVCEGRAVGDCECLEEPAVPAQPAAAGGLTPVGGVKSNPFDYHPEDDQQPAAADTDEETVPGGAYAIATRFTVNLLPETDINSHVFEITAEYRGHGQWAVLRHGWCLDVNGQWDYELRPSEREDDWIAAHRFDLDTALRLAKEQAPLVTVNGLTAAAALRRLAAEDPS